MENKTCVKLAVERKVICADSYSVGLKFVINLLEEVENRTDDWSAQTYIGFLNLIIAENPLAQAKLIVRRERDIAEVSVTLLSENDRILGDSFTDIKVFTMYKVTGSKGWAENRFGFRTLSGRAMSFIIP